MSAASGVVAIVGGGIAGLSAAYELLRRDVPFVLLEGSGRWGGVIRTERADGFLLEGGPDTLLAQKPAGLALIHELGLDRRLVPVNTEHRTLYVLHRGRLHALPDGMVLGVPTRVAPLVRTRLFSWPGKLRMGADLVIPRGRPGSDESIAAFFRRRLGREALERLGGPFLAGIHAGDPEHLLLPANFPALTALEARHGSVIRGLLASRPRSAGPPPPMFYSLRDGLGELVDGLVARLPADRLRLRCPVRDLRRNGDGFVLSTDGDPEVRARAVVLAVPAHRASELLAGLDAHVAAALAEVRFASTAAVSLGYRREDVTHPLDGHGLIVPEAENIHTSACSFVSTKFPGRAPDGHVLLRGFLGGMRRPASLDESDDGLAARVHAEMAPVIGLRAQPVLKRVYRWPSATASAWRRWRRAWRGGQVCCLLYAVTAVTPTSASVFGSAQWAGAGPLFRNGPWLAGGLTHPWHVSRPLRLEHPGAVWHITARGNERRDVYRDDVDRERWLGLLGKTVVLFAWRLHGYVQMGNHYHLIVETPIPSLSRGMRHLNGVYTQAFNRRHGRVGHLFQGRFKSILVERDSHLLELLRYVVLNPVRAGLVHWPGEWAWSSYRATAGEAPRPTWLETAWSLAQFGGNTRAAEQRYREFVGEGRGLPRDPWGALRGQIYLGSDAFVHSALGQAAQRARDPEIPRPQREPGRDSLEQILPAILGVLATTDRELACHPRKRVRERAIVAYTLRRFAGATGTTIARVLGVSAWRALALARAGEGHWNGDARLAASVDGALGRSVDLIQQT